MPAFPKAMRWLAARWTPHPDLPLSLKPLSASAGHSSGTGMHALAPRHWLEYDQPNFATEIGMKKKVSGGRDASESGASC